MKKSQIVLNHLVFASDRENGGQQLDMLKKVVGFGIQSAELRREYFDDIIAETPAICVFSIRYPMICLLIIALIQS